MSRRHGRATMPWGKYKGVRIRLIPDDYLSWLTTIKLMRDPRWGWLRESLISELKFRDLRYDLADTEEPVIDVPDDDLSVRAVEVYNKMKSFISY